MQGTSPPIMNAQILIPPKSNIKSISVVSNLINDTILNTEIYQLWTRKSRLVQQKP